MNDLLKVLLSGAAGYAIGSRLTDDDVKRIIDAYLRAVTIDKLLADYRLVNGIVDGDYRYVDELKRALEVSQYQGSCSNYGMNDSYPL